MTDCYITLTLVGDDMEAKKALQSVQAAEEKARALITEAKERAKKIANEAISSADEQYKAIVTEGKAEKKKITDRARSSGEDTAREMIEKGLKDADAIRHIDDEKINSVVDSIVKEIVNNNGNR